MPDGRLFALLDGSCGARTFYTGRGGLWKTAECKDNTKERNKNKFFKLFIIVNIKTSVILVDLQLPL